MRATGLEPVQPQCSWILSPLRLPFRHARKCWFNPVIPSITRGLIHLLMFTSTVIMSLIHKVKRIPIIPPTSYPPSIIWQLKSFDFNLGDRTWTCDFLNPNQVLYQTEPHPEVIQDKSEFMTYCTVVLTQPIYHCQQWDFLIVAISVTFKAILYKWTILDLNQWPSAYEAGILTDWTNGPKGDYILWAPCFLTDSTHEVLNPLNGESGIWTHEPNWIASFQDWCVKPLHHLTKQNLQVGIQGDFDWIGK